MGDRHDELAVCAVHRNADFEYVATKKGYRIMWTETKVVRHKLTKVHTRIEDAWKEAAEKVAKL